MKSGKGKSFIFSGKICYMTKEVAQTGNVFRFLCYTIQLYYTVNITKYFIGVAYTYEMYYVVLGFSFPSGLCLL